MRPGAVTLWRIPPVKARIHVSLKPGVLDPQGKAILGALESMGFDGVQDARQGKLIELDLDDDTDADTARARVDDMCRRLLANTVIEKYTIDLEG
nr:phosphoribosylformylglycinamidine synthase subunit PurS [Roseospira visakhapatnamensis]